MNTSAANPASLSASTRRTDLYEKRDAYLTIPSLKVLVFVDSGWPSATLHRAEPGGGCGIERHTGREEGIPLQEIDACLPLAEVNERVTFAA